MHAFPTLASLALLLASRVHASIYVTDPVQSSTCTGGQSCNVAWVDNGESPLLSQIGECEVGLYMGELVLAQSLPSVDVSTTSSFTFTVDPSAGPNGQYYIVFTSNSISYQGFSASFTLTGMTGTTPGGGSSAPASTSATAPAGSSTSAGSSATGASPSGSASAPSGTSTPVVGPTTPTGSTSAAGTTVATGTTPSSGTPTATTPTTTTTTTTTTKTTTSASASASSTNAAGRVGSSTSLGGVAALLVLSGVLAF